MTFKKSEVISFLRDNPIISISAIDEKKPLASVVLTATEDSGEKYFACSKNSYKAKALLKNPQISWSIWKDKKMLVQADGKTEQIFGSELSEALDKIVYTADSIENFWPPILSITDEEYVVFKITTKWMRAFDLRDLKMTENTPPFTIFEGNL